MKIKNTFLPIIIFLVFIISVHSNFYEVNYECKNNICIEGQIANWSLTIFNRGDSPIEYTEFEFVEKFNDSIFMHFDTGFQPLSSERGSTIVVDPTQNVKVLFNGTMPAANSGFDLLYYICLTTATPNDDWTHRDEGIYEIRRCYDQNETMPVLECIANDYCEYNEVCKNYECKIFKCGECQYFDDHVCNDYDCCDSAECNFDEACLNNSCIDLNCEDKKFPINHTCVQLNCSMDEIIIHNECTKLNCSINEYADNHTCIELICNEQEIIENHECKILECKGNEYAKNHTCVEFECKFDEKFENHGCEKLECPFFKKIMDHSCRIDKQLIYKLLAEITALALIIFFIILDIKKYKSKHKKIKKVYK